MAAKQLAVIALIHYKYIKSDYAGYIDKLNILNPTIVTVLGTNKMKGQIQEDVVVAVPATAMWAVYGTIKLSDLARELLPNVIVHCEQGDGSVGTIFKVSTTNENGEPLASYFKEKYLLVDDEKHIKVTQHIEGEYAEAGFDYFGARLEVVDIGDEICIIRSVVEYEIDFKRIEDAALPSVKFLRVLEALAHVVANYVTNKN